MVEISAYPGSVGAKKWGKGRGGIYDPKLKKKTLHSKIIQKNVFISIKKKENLFEIKNLILNLVN